MRRCFADPATLFRHPSPAPMPPNTDPLPKRQLRRAMPANWYDSGNAGIDFVTNAPGPGRVDKGEIVMRIVMTVVTIVAIGFAATSASAARRPLVAAVAAKVTPRFAAIDINANGSLDATEWAATGSPPNSFDLVDRNDNGSIGLFELIRVAVAKIVARRR